MNFIMTPARLMTSKRYQRVLRRARIKSRQAGCGLVAATLQSEVWNDTGL
jgi:hypothetical protein